jgi:hypothetical protein
MTFNSVTGRLITNPDELSCAGIYRVKVTAIEKGILNCIKPQNATFETLITFNTPVQTGYPL